MFHICNEFYHVENINYQTEEQIWTFIKERLRFYTIYCEIPKDIISVNIKIENYGKR